MLKFMKAIIRKLRNDSVTRASVDSYPSAGLAEINAAYRRWEERFVKPLTIAVCAPRQGVNCSSVSEYPEYASENTSMRFCCTVFSLATASGGMSQLPVFAHEAAYSV